MRWVNGKLTELLSGKGVLLCTLKIVLTIVREYASCDMLRHQFVGLSFKS